MRSDPPPIEVTLLGIDALLVNLAVIKRVEKAMPAPWKLAIAVRLERIAQRAERLPCQAKSPQWRSSLSSRPVVLVCRPSLSFTSKKQ